MTRRRPVLITAFVLIACLPLIAAAQPGDRSGHRGPDRHHMPPAEYLDLTEEQTEAAKALHESVRADHEELRVETRALHESLREELDSGDAHAATIGQMVIDLHAMKDQMSAARRQIDEDFSALLTAEQLEKYENFKELRRDKRDGRGQRFGRGRSPRPDGPPDHPDSEDF